MHGVCDVHLHIVYISKRDGRGHVNRALCTGVCVCACVCMHVCAQCFMCEKRALLLTPEANPSDHLTIGMNLTCVFFSLCFLAVLVFFQFNIGSNCGSTSRAS
jgi:hypothetical protein